MNVLLVMIPGAMLLALAGLAAFIWSLRAGPVSYTHLTLPTNREV